MTASTASLSAATVHLERASPGRDIVCCFMSVFKTSGHEKAQTHCGGNLGETRPSGVLPFSQRGSEVIKT